MGSKETNRVNQFGVLPSQGADPIPVGKIPDLGTQVAEDGLAVNGTVVFYTVPADKTFYMTMAVVSYYAAAGGVEGRLYARDVLDALAYYITRPVFPANFTLTDNITFNPPLEIPTGYDICLDSTSANMLVRAFIHGYVR